MIAMQSQTISEEWVEVITPLMLRTETSGTSSTTVESQESLTNKLNQL
jgi:hypothetical protein